MKCQIGLFAAIAWFLMTGSALADEPTSQQDLQGEDEISSSSDDQEDDLAAAAAADGQVDENDAGPNSGALYFGAGIDYVSAYLFRGFVLDDESVILQPWIEAGMTLYHGDSWFSSVDLILLLWNSLHFDSDTAGVEIVPRHWYENDLTVTLSFLFLDSLSFDAGYFWYMSPNGNFTTYEEANFRLSYDDSALWASIAPFFGGIQPSLMMGIELDGQSDGGPDKGIFLNPGIEPNATFGNPDGFQVNLSLPLSLGLSASNYYEGEKAYEAGLIEDVYGFFDLGLTLGIPLFFIPDAFGSWEISANGHLQFQGEVLQDANSEAVGSGGALVTEADLIQPYGGVGLTLSY